jgi:hypothetical protein
MPIKKETIILQALDHTKSSLFKYIRSMETMRVNILNPKAAKILKDLADLKLIAIQDTSEDGFANVLKKIRKKAKSAPTIEEISAEVELVRSERYAK